VTLEAAADALVLFEVDERGLDRVDLSILTALVERFDGGPVGLTTISAAVGEDTGTIEEVYEPYLLQIGFLQRTPRGRMATEAAYGRLV
jgi:Holliday junction DNA helicase RuvB